MPHLEKSDNASIAMISSTAALEKFIAAGAYNSMKAAIIQYAGALAQDVGAKGIRVNVVAPGLVDTPLASAITGNPLMLKASESMHPLGRIGQPDEVAQVIGWLLSEDSSWITGQVIGVDGGLSSIRSKISA